MRQTRADLKPVRLPEAQQEFGIRSLVEQQVGRQVAQFEIELLKNFQRITEHIAQENARAVADQLEDRIQMLENISARQSAILARLSAPGQLAGAPMPAATSQPEERATPECAGVDSGLDEHGRGNAIEYPSLHCPRCTSRRIRRATRANFFEQSIRFLGLAPFRCRACRYKFYRFNSSIRPADFSPIN